jgi:hypothetical protein
MEALMTTFSEVDAALVDWGNRVFNGGPVKKRIRKGMTGLRLVPRNARATDAANRGMDAAAVRRKIGSIVKRTPQVMVRISGGGKGIRHVKAHLDYISRNGQIVLEDQNGDSVEGREAVNALRDEWQFGGFPIDATDDHRQAFNVVLSMPAGTDEMAVLRAARDFAATEFTNFQYAMALHTFDTDPDKDPSPNPHVHLCVKATGLDGVRLNPRKDDLRRWREKFAERLREQGVACEATSRLHRLQRKRGEKQSVRHKKARGEQFDRVGKGLASTERAERARGAESKILRGYGHLARALAKSDEAEDRKLAVGFAHRVGDLKSEKIYEHGNSAALAPSEKGRDER